MKFLLPLALFFVVGVVASAQPLFGVRFDEGRSHPYDVLHTAIDVRFDEARREVIGSVSHRVRVLTEELGTIAFDADSAIHVSRASVDARAAEHRSTVSALEITLPRAARYGDTLTVAIDYRAVPSKGLYFRAPDSTDPRRREQIWTQGEAEDHHFWVPLYDFPNDRLTSEMRITVREEWKALSNGDLVSRRSNGDGTETWHYRMDRPHVSYLIMMAAGDYLVTRDTVDGIPLSYWTYPDMPERVAPTFGSTPDVMRFLVERIGVPYPWKSYAQVFVDDFMYGGMENTTASTLNDDALVDRRGRIDYSPENLIAHELAHQWFGDLVTARDWGHLWLQESMVTYLASLYEGYRFGEAAFLNDMWEGGAAAMKLDSISGSDPIASGKGQTTNLYYRGARVLHMLAKLVGERQFRDATRLYLARHADGVVETADFKNALEDATGLELDWFFDQWIYGAGTPYLQVDRQVDGDSLRLVLRQIQTRDSLTGIFQFPLPIALHHARGVVRDTVWFGSLVDTVTMHLPSAFRYVVVDEGQTTMKRLAFDRTSEELSMQSRAANMLDRWEAVMAIGRVDSTNRAEPWRSMALLRAYREEPTSEVREAILGAAAGLESPGAAEIFAEAMSDSAAYVRRMAIDWSWRIPDPARRAELLRARLGDSSLRVVAGTLSALASTDTVGLAAELDRWRGVEGRRGEFAREWVEAASVAGIERFVDDIVAYTRPQYGRTTRWQAYTALRSMKSTTPAVREAIVRGMTDPAKIVRDAAAEAALSHLDEVMRTRLRDLRAALDDEGRAAVDAMLEAN